MLVNREKHVITKVKKPRGVKVASVERSEKRKLAHTLGSRDKSIFGCYLSRAILFLYVVNKLGVTFI
jgi:hypothetical protein